MPELRIRFASGPVAIDETHAKARGKPRFGLRQSDTESPSRAILDLCLEFPSVFFDQQYAARIREAAARSAACAVTALSAVHSSRLLGSNSTVDFVVETHRRERETLTIEREVEKKAPLVAPVEAAGTKNQMISGYLDDSGGFWLNPPIQALVKRYLLVAKPSQQGRDL